MPTGYTSDLYEGKDQTFEEFVLRCARGMGAFIMQRDDNPNALPALREESTYQQKTLDGYREKLAKFNAMSERELTDAYNEAVAKIRKSNKEELVRKQEIRERYEMMLARVVDWKVDPMLDSFKAFMIEQLKSSIEFDAKPYVVPIPSYDEWKQNKFDFLTRMIKVYEKEVAEEKDRVAKQHEYTRKLYAALNMEVP